MNYLCRCVGKYVLVYRKKRRIKASSLQIFKFKTFMKTNDIFELGDKKDIKFFMS